MLCSVNSPVKGDVFQIATGIETSIRDLSELIQKTVARPIDSTLAEARAGDVRRNYSSIAKATSVMGWKPGVSLAEAYD